MSDMLIRKSRPFVYATNGIFEMPISPTAFKLYMLIASYCAAQRVAWPSVPTLAKKMGMSERQTQRNLGELTDYGLIERHLRQDKETNTNISTLYVVCDAEDTRWYKENVGDGVMGDTIDGVMGDTKMMSWATPKEYHMKNTNYLYSDAPEASVHEDNPNTEATDKVFPFSRIQPKEENDDALVYESSTSHQDGPSHSEYALNNKKGAAARSYEQINHGILTIRPKSGVVPVVEKPVAKNNVIEAASSEMASWLQNAFESKLSDQALKSIGYKKSVETDNGKLEIKPAYLMYRESLVYRMYCENILAAYKAMNGTDSIEKFLSVLLNYKRSGKKFPGWFEFKARNESEARPVLVEDETALKKEWETWLQIAAIPESFEYWLSKRRSNV